MLYSFIIYLSTIHNTYNFSFYRENNYHDAFKELRREKITSQDEKEYIRILEEAVIESKKRKEEAAANIKTVENENFF